MLFDASGAHTLHRPLARRLERRICGGGQAVPDARITELDAFHEAEAFIRGLFKQATLDIEQELERLSLRQLLHLLTRVRLSTLAVIGGFVASVFGAGVWVGRLIC